MSHDAHEHFPEDVQGDETVRKEKSHSVKKYSRGIGATCGLSCLAMVLVFVIAAIVGTINCQPGTYEHYLTGDACGLGEMLTAMGIDALILIACFIIIAILNKRIRDSVPRVEGIFR